MAFESRLTGAEPVRPIRESILLPTDNRVPKLLLTAEEYLAERRYEELTDLLMQLTETHGRELVLAPSRSAVQVNRYVNVAQYCQRMLTDLPPAGRAVCRESALSSARMWSTGRIVS